MERESQKILDAIHKNHEYANKQHKIETLKREEREKSKREREHKEEISEARAMVMMAISLVLITFVFWGVI